jgi:hypothetical protein
VRDSFSPESSFFALCVAFSNFPKKAPQKPRQRPKNNNAPNEKTPLLRANHRLDSLCDGHTAIAIVPASNCNGYLLSIAYRYM